VSWIPSREVDLLIDSIQEVSYVSTLLDHASSGICFTSLMVVWDPGIILSFNMVQSMGRLVVMVLLEENQYLGREDCDVPIFGFLCCEVGGDHWGSFHLDQRVKWRLTVSSEGLREFYEAQTIPFTIFHHRDHLFTVPSWFHGILTILIIWLIIEHNLIKYTNGITRIILSQGIPWCNSSLESRKKHLKVGMTRKKLIMHMLFSKNLNLRELSWLWLLG
jgi:hypothetical protein